MKFSRADKSRLAEWWFTVDHVLLYAIMVIVAAGLVAAAHAGNTKTLTDTVEVTITSCAPTHTNCPYKTGGQNEWEAWATTSSPADPTGTWAPWDPSKPSTSSSASSAPLR